MKDSRKDLIKKLHSNSDCSTKQEIETEFPKLFNKKVELNNWFVDDNYPKWLMYFSDTGIRYGFDGSGNWIHKNDKTYDPRKYNDNILAPPQEIKTRLIAEAKRRGYENGNYKCLFLPKKTNEIDEYTTFYIYVSDYNQLWIEDESTNLNKIFEKGVWADVIETVTKAEAEKLIGKKIVD